MFRQKNGDSIAITFSGTTIVALPVQTKSSIDGIPARQPIKIFVGRVGILWTATLSRKPGRPFEFLRDSRTAENNSANDNSGPDEHFSSVSDYFEQ